MALRTPGSAYNAFLDGDGYSPLTSGLRAGFAARTFLRRLEFGFARKRFEIVEVFDVLRLQAFGGTAKGFYPLQAPYAAAPRCGAVYGPARGRQRAMAPRPTDPTPELTRRPSTDPPAKPGKLGRTPSPIPPPP